MKYYKKPGFTLIEMMVSIGIITLLSVMILAYNHQAETITALTRSANKLVFELQRIQNQAMLVYQTGGEEGEKICGWGMYFTNLPSTSTIVFSDSCTEDNKTKGDYRYLDKDKEKKEEIPLVKQTEIFDSNIKSVVFVPPEPRIYFDPQNINEVIDEAIIKLRLENQLSDYPYYEIIISKSGQIYKKQILTADDEEK